MSDVVSYVTPDQARKARYIVGAVVAVIAILVVVLATRPAADGDVANPVVGQDAPAVVGTALDGRQVDLASMRGRWVVVNFFATWCLPCRQEHPELIAFTEQHTSPTAPAVVAIGFDKNDVASARSFFASEGGNWPVVPDADGRVSIGFGVRALPETFIVNPDGKITARVSGAVNQAQLNRLTQQI